MWSASAQSRSTTPYQSTAFSEYSRAPRPLSRPGSHRVPLPTAHRSLDEAQRSQFVSLFLSNRSYSGSGGNLNGTIVSAGSVLTWFSDVNIVGVGFIICAVPPNTVFSCNFFARGFCGMSHDGRWALGDNTGTLSAQTGPALGQLTEMDGFAFIEASNEGANFSNLSVSGLQLPLGGYALFWYHM